MNVVYWSDQAHGYMLIGRNPADTLNDLAGGADSARCLSRSFLGANHYTNGELTL